MITYVRVAPPERNGGLWSVYTRRLSSDTGKQGPETVDYRGSHEEARAYANACIATAPKPPSEESK